MTPVALLPDDRRHGTITGYTNYRCRCSLCREAWRSYAATSPSHRVHNRARSIAATWVRRNRPEIWALSVDQARSEIEASS